MGEARCHGGPKFDVFRYAVCTWAMEEISNPAGFAAIVFSLVLATAVGTAPATTAKGGGNWPRESNAVHRGQGGPGLLPLIGGKPMDRAMRERRSGDTLCG